MAFGYSANTVYAPRGHEELWYIEEWQLLDWQEAEMVCTIYQSESGDVAIRPFLEEDGDRLFWQEGIYNPESYNDFYTRYQYVDLYRFD